MNSNREELEINLMDEFKFILENKLKLIIASSVFSLLFAIYSLTLPKEYSSTVTFIPSKTNLQSSGSSMSGLAGLVGIGGVGSGPSQTSISLAVLNSRSFLNFFAEKNKVNPFLFPDDWNELDKTWIRGKPNSESVASSIRELISISSNQDIYELEFEWTDPIQTAAWANLIIKDLNDHLRLQEIESGELKISFLNAQLKKNTINDIDNVFFKMIEDQTKNNMLTNVTDSYAFKILDEAIEATNNHKPKRFQIIALGFFVGFFFGIIFIYLDKWLRAIQQR